MREEIGQEYLTNIGEDGEVLEAPTMYRVIGGVVLKVPAGEAVTEGQRSGDRWNDVIEAMAKAVEKGK